MAVVGKADLRHDFLDRHCGVLQQRFGVLCFHVVDILDRRHAHTFFKKAHKIVWVKVCERSSSSTVIVLSKWELI